MGLPNAGKSSLLRSVSAARPKVGPYPFTTLEPHLGVAQVGYETLVVADIPGLIEGAHEGAGLGVAFLRHIERTRLLVHIVDTSTPDPLADVEVVRGELAVFGRGLPEKEWLIAVNKIDLPGAREAAGAAAREVRRRGVAAFPISARTGEGTRELMEEVFVRVRRLREADRAIEHAPEAVSTRRVSQFEVRRIAGGFAVVGEGPRRAVLKLGVESEEARAELVRRLRRMGVVGALRRAGAQPGDRVRIGKAELEWPL